MAETSKGVGPSLDVAIRNAHDALTQTSPSTLKRSRVIALGVTSGGFTGAHEYQAEVVEVIEQDV